MLSIIPPPPTILEIGAGLRVKTIFGAVVKLPQVVVEIFFDDCELIEVCIIIGDEEFDELFEEEPPRFEDISTNFDVFILTEGAEKIVEDVFVVLFSCIKAFVEAGFNE